MTAPLIRPPALRPGDRVAVLSASSAVPAESLEAGLARLRAAGLDPVVLGSARDAGSWRPYLAGTDELRARDLQQALTDPTIAGVLVARGGSGAGRTVAAVDWDAVRGAAPKIVAGYSDVTAVLEAVAVELGWASVHGATTASDGEHAAVSTDSLLEMVMSPPDTITFPAARIAVGGVARGVTVGGNVSVLEASLGTPTSRPAAGGIALFEDLEEPPYRLDRMFTHLLRAGYLDGVAGIVCGRFSDCGPDELVADILLERLGGLGVPMVLDADIGHSGPNRAFPIGVAAELDADAGTVRLVEPTAGG
ncbi:S66 peptidase family protein [Jatrophihabitans fulvus]